MNPDHSWFTGAIGISAGPAGPLPTVSSRPRASALARLQSAWGDDIVTPLHETVELSDAHRRLIRLLDGSLDLDGVVDALDEHVAGETQDQRAQRPPGGPADRVPASAPGRAALTRHCAAMLEDLARQGLLVG